MGQSKKNDDLTVNGTTYDWCEDKNDYAIKVLQPYEEKLVNIVMVPTPEKVYCKPKRQKPVIEVNISILKKKMREKKKIEIEF